MSDLDPLIEHVRDFVDSHEPGSYKFETIGGTPYDLVVYALTTKDGLLNHACGLVDSTLLADMFLFDEDLVLIDRSQNTALRPEECSPDYNEDSNSKQAVVHRPESTN